MKASLVIAGVGIIIILSPAIAAASQPAPTGTAQSPTQGKDASNGSSAAPASTKSSTQTDASCDASGKSAKSADAATIKRPQFKDMGDPPTPPKKKVGADSDCSGQ